MKHRGCQTRGRSRHRRVSSTLIDEPSFATHPRTRVVLTRSGGETMGRVYDALKRAETAPRQTPSSTVPTRRDNSGNVSYFVPKNGYEQQSQIADSRSEISDLRSEIHPWESAAFTGAPPAFESASTAHTTEVTGGPA